MHRVLPDPSPQVPQTLFIVQTFNSSFSSRALHVQSLGTQNFPIEEDLLFQSTNHYHMTEGLLEGTFMLYDWVTS